MTMSGEQFWKTVVAGLIATYVMTMTGFWQSGLGLAALDVGAMITDSMTAAHPDAPMLSMTDSSFVSSLYRLEWTAAQ